MFPNRTKHDYFSEITDKFKNETGLSKNRRLDVTEIMHAANDILLGQTDESGQFLERKVQNGETSYNREEFWIAKDVTEELLAKDVKEGKTSKYVLKIMSDPKSIPHWEQARFENLKRSEEAMKLIRKQIAKAKREGKYINESEDEEGKEKVSPAYFDPMMKIDAE